jgi:hypothetical protein
MDESAAVEAVLWTEQCEQTCFVSLFDRALDNDIKSIRKTIPIYDCFVWTKVGNVERGAQGLGFAWRQTVEWRIVKVERFRHI